MNHINLFVIKKYININNNNDNQKQYIALPESVKPIYNSKNNKFVTKDLFFKVTDGKIKDFKEVNFAKNKSRNNNINTNKGFLKRKRKLKKNIFLVHRTKKPKLSKNLENEKSVKHDDNKNDDEGVLSMGEISKKINKLQEENNEINNNLKKIIGEYEKNKEQELNITSKIKIYQDIIKEDDNLQKEKLELKENKIENSKKEEKLDNITNDKVKEIYKESQDIIRVKLIKKKKRDKRIFSIEKQKINKEDTISKEINKNKHDKKMTTIKKMKKTKIK